MMTSIEIESWTLRVVRQVTNGQPNEDALVELKTVVPTDIPKTARHIAAMINSSYSNHVLWILGVDEKGRSVPGVSAFEVSDWWAKIETQFDELPPSVQNLSVPIDGSVVIALAFETDRAPLVVKNPDGGRFSRDVPYRTGNRTDSARRSDLIRLLVPPVRMPNFEILDSHFGALKIGGGHSNPSASMTVYALPQNRDRVVFPFHKLSLDVLQNGRSLLRGLQTKVHAYRGATGSAVSQTIIESGSEIIIDGPGRFDLSAEGDLVRLGTFEPVELLARLSPAGTNAQAILKVVLEYQGDPAQVSTWKPVRQNLKS